MLRAICKKRIFKVLAVFVALSVVTQIAMPTVAFALTSGPSQPEMSGFTPYGTSEMVNMFTGDFSYNIPLLTVPGPNGGYPINLSYQAGITMEQEASWVGLGWNINTGVLKRDMRGLPDDFKGDKVVKENYMKPQRTVSFNVSVSPTNIELFGKDLDKDKNGGLEISLNAGLYYDNYRGIGSISGAGISLPLMDKGNSKIAAGLNYEFDSKDGVDVSPNMSFSHTNSNFVKSTAGFGATINSRQGFKDYHYNSSMTFMGKSSGSGASFASSSRVPTSEIGMSGWNGTFEAKMGYVVYGSTVDGTDTDLHYSESSIKKEYRKKGYTSYGFYYADQRNGDLKSLGDFNREKDGEVNKNSKVLPIPQATPDAFHASAQGLGLSFNTYRGDVGIFHDPIVQGGTTDGGGGLEFDASLDLELKSGFNARAAKTSTYYGPWTDRGDNLTNTFSFTPQVPNAGYEAAYFKAVGDITPANGSSTFIHNDDPVQVLLQSNKDAETDADRPMVTKRLASPSAQQGFTSTYLAQRDKREHLIHAFTRAELLGMGESQTVVKSGGTYNAYTDQSVRKPHHFGKFRIVNAEGQIYDYGLPVYNLKQKDASFSQENVDKDAKTVSYSSGDNSSGNKKGLAHAYSSVTTPAYAHSYMLTGIFSPDYADLTGDGPTEDDLGTYVKFQYSTTTADGAYKWRVPYGNMVANSMANHYSNPQDDMASYTYGEKELFYIHRIETKTHYAEFIPGDRHDAIEVKGENGGAPSPTTSAANNKQRKLDQIALYKKVEGGSDILIKTVNFKYDYSLFAETMGLSVPNNNGQASADSHTENNTQKGKLTLKQVWFEYGNNNKGSFSPYKFTYGQDYPYSSMLADRWGGLQGEDPYMPNHIFPYTDQRRSEAERNAHATAWNMTKIELPSGGTINVEYEPDDYAYVQDKRAMLMFKITDTGSNLGKPSEDGALSSEKRRIYFKLLEPLASDASANDIKTEVGKYLEGVDQVYFKVYMKLMKGKSSGNWEWDYVEGYAKTDVNTATGEGYGVAGGEKDGSGNHLEAYFTVKAVDISDNSKASSGVTHPFSKAGWQYIRRDRDDLLNGTNTLKDNIAQIAQAVSPVVNMIAQLGELKSITKGWYSTANSKGYCREIGVKDTERGSIVRLNAPEYIKYGGGHRVKRITMTDGWNALNDEDVNYSDYSYGQTYEYRLTNGRSSGVAEYEPLLGGEENPFRLPVPYSSDKLINKDKALYVEEPINENLFPAPNVGYSRVVMRPLERTFQDSNSDTRTILASATGYEVHEYYTAKDYPIETAKTNLQKLPIAKKLIIIPFHGTRNIINYGYSQGFSISLNDMHGKLKKVSRYGARSDLKSPNSYTEYHYHTEGGYKANARNKLKSHVMVLGADEFPRYRAMGRQVSMCTDMRESFSEAESIGTVMNLHLIPAPVIKVPPIPLPISMLSSDYSATLFRMITSNKVITRNAILEKVTHFDKGATVLERNLYYDEVTGKPLVTSIENNYSNNVQTYNYAAHWAHATMGPAAKNINAQIDDASYASTLLIPGDVLMDADYNQYWVKETTPSLVLIDETDQTATFASLTKPLKVIRSGNRNLLNMEMGQIVSIDNVLTDGWPLFEEYEKYVNGEPGQPAFQRIPGTDIKYDGCDGVEHDAQATLTGPEGNLPSDQFQIYENYGVGTCSIIYDFDGENVQDFETTYGGGLNVLFNEDYTTIKFYSGTDTIVGTLLSTSLECLEGCLPGVIRTYANVYSDDWNCDALSFEDVGLSPCSTKADVNPYRYGAKGVWRLKESYNFLEERRQANPGNIAEDGVIKTFTKYDWSDANPRWLKTSTVNKYSPYGQALEEVNSLGIHSSALYGYNNSLATAVAANATYYEIGFEGFEEYNGSYNVSHHKGHFNFDNTTPLSTEASHTGKYSVKLTSSSTEFDATVDQTGKYFGPVANSDYYVSCWVKSTNHDTTASLELIYGATTYKFLPDPNLSPIEGWKRIEATFTAPASGDVTFRLAATDGTAYFDDLRVQPMKSAMKTYVYDPATQWLSAELDDNNYATFYNYDSEGNLVQTKKETERGIMTIVSGRKNTRQVP